MASLNPLTREVVFKIVFYGPGLGGKTTTLQHIHAQSKPEHRGKMVSLATPMDRTLYFDFLPLRVPLLQGMNVRLQLFTVPGQVYFGATRKLVLTGADGVVFVADSQPARQDANHEALEDLVMNLADNNLALLHMPHTFHWNKRDIPDVVSVADLDRSLNPQGAPSLGTVATSGEGVFPGLERITRLVLEAYESGVPKSESSGEGARPGVDAQPAIEENTIADALRGLAEAPGRAVTADGESAKAPPSSRGGAAPHVSSLESIPNPIPRRSTGSFESPAPSSNTRAGAPSSRGPATPYPAGESRAASPAPPRVASSPAPSAVPASEPPSSAREEPKTRISSRELAAVAPPSPAGREPSGVSFLPLWSEGDRDAARHIEVSLASGDGAAAVLACDVLVMRLLSSVEGAKDAAIAALLLGIEGKRYVTFRSLVRAARAREGVSPSDALGAYLLALDVRVAAAR